MSAIGNISNNYLQTSFSCAIQKQNTGDPLSGLLAPQSSQKPDSGQLSPFAQLVSKLQDLQQSDPAKYQQVTAQIAANLQSAAQNAGANGNTTQAAQLSQIASDFTDASKSGQLPNLKDLAQAVSGGHHGHRHHAHAAASTGGDVDATKDVSTTTSSQGLSQLLASLQPGGTRSNSAFDAASIIFDTLNGAGSATSANN